MEIVQKHEGNALCIALSGELGHHEALTAMRVCRSFKSVTLCAAAVSVVCFFVGLCTSYLLSTAAGATVVVANILAFLIFAAVGRLRG